MIRGKISNRGNIVSGYLADFNDINENIYNDFLKYVKDCNDNMLDFDFWKTFYYFCALNPDGGETFTEDYCLYPEIIKERDEFVDLKYSFLNNDNGQPDIITFSTKEDNSYQIFEYNNFFDYYDFFFKDKKLIHFKSDDSSFSLFSKNSKYIYRKI